MHKLEQNKTKHPWALITNNLQGIFRKHEVPHFMMWIQISMIPKPGINECCGIGFTSTTWNIVSIIINKRIQDTIEFHPWIHGFRMK